MQMGHQVTIFAASTVHNSDRNLITDGSRWREEIVDGVHYVYIKCLDYQNSGLKRIYNICEFAWKLPGVCKRFARPDAIVATSMPPMSCAAGIRLARKYKCRGVAEIADLWPESIVAYDIAGPKNPAVIAVNNFRKEMKGQAENILFAEDGEVILVNRGNKGAAIINLAIEANAVELATSLPDGNYADRVYGKSFQVENGVLKGTAEPETTYILTVE